MKLVISRIIELFRYTVEGKLPAGEEFQSFTVREKKLLDIDILMTSSNVDRIIMLSFKIARRLFVTLGKRDQLSQF